MVTGGGETGAIPKKTPGGEDVLEGGGMQDNALHGLFKDEERKLPPPPPVPPKTQKDRLMMDATGLSLDGQYLSMHKSYVQLYQTRFKMDPSEDNRQKLEEAQKKYASMFAEATDFLVIGGHKGAPIMAEYLAQLGPVVSQPSLSTNVSCLPNCPPNPIHPELNLLARTKGCTISLFTGETSDKVDPRAFMLQIEKARGLFKLDDEDTILLLQNKLGGIAQTWHDVTIEALQRIGKGSSWASYKAKFLYRFYKGKDESDFNNITKITYQWSKARPPSELLEQLFHFLGNF